LNSSRNRTNSRKGQTKQAEDPVTRALTKAPTNQRRLTDGRDTKTILLGMIREWEEIRGGRFECRLVGSRWAHLSDDSLAIGDYRPLGLSTDMCAVSDHATARTFGSGYRDFIVGHAAPVSYWSALTTLDDMVPVMLAVLDRELTGGIACLDWYLQTSCPPRLCQEHPAEDGTPFCGSMSCTGASPGTPCDCSCGGANHGMGKEAVQALPPEMPDWSTAPAPLWRPGAGSVEIDREHRRIVGRDPFSRHGSRVRPPSMAWTSRTKHGA
jgi:hypothetical protein